MPKMMYLAIPQNTNKFGGFFRTISMHKRRAWNTAIVEFHKRTKCNPEAVRVWLESSHGRHFADGINEELCDYFPAGAVSEVVTSCVKSYLRTQKKAFINDANKWYVEQLAYDMNKAIVDRVP